MLGEEEHVELWTEPSIMRPVDVMTVAGFEDEVLELIRERDIHCQTYIRDVEELVVEERERYKAQKIGAAGEFNLTIYHDYYETMEHLDDLADQYEFMETEVIGQSWEGRDLKIIKICKGGCGKKPAIWIDGGIHAREWISPATALWTIHSVLSDERMMEELDWFIHPIVNPDGFTFTHEHTRLWRKTRSDHGSILFCRGVDGNRNYGHHWNEGGSSNDKCFDTYHGPSGFSEPETAAIRDFILSQEGRIQYFNNMHSYSQFVLLSWGYTTQPPDNYMEFYPAAYEGAAALTAVHGTEYTIGCIPCILYVASGGASDWALGVANSTFSFSMELRDTGRYGFLLPDRFIQPVGEETWEFHKVIAEAVIQKFGSKH